MQFKQKIEMFRVQCGSALISAICKNLYKLSPTYAKGISVARRSVLISQLADDTTENEKQTPNSNSYQCCL